MTIVQSILKLQHCNAATPQQRVQSQTRLSYAERQQCRHSQQLQQYVHGGDMLLVRNIIVVKVLVRRNTLNRWNAQIRYS